MWKTGEPEVYGNYIVMLKDGTVTQDYYASFGWDDNGSNVVAYTDFLDQCGVCDEDICNDCKFLKQVYVIDTRKYDDSFLLAKILEKVDFSDEEKKKLFKHFEKPEASDAELVRHGHWVPQITALGTMIFHCSDCQRFSDVNWAYCPRCGTKMDGERKEND